jgi:hypothetical protein
MAAEGALTGAQVQSFLDNGYLIVRDCLDLDVAQRWTTQAYERLGYDPHDPATWAKDIVWMDHHQQRPVRELAPKAWDTLLAVVGGEARLETRVMGKPRTHFSSINSFAWSDAFIINFRRGADQLWQPPSARVSGWHKDGSYFRHFLDSPEQALLTIVLWSDMRHQGGGTFIAPDSVRVVARLLAEHPEGLEPGEIDFQALVGECRRFEELTGNAGDLIILHPFMLHASSQNVLGVPRFMTNPPIVLKEPLNYNRANPAEFSLLERATLHYLGVERLDFRPTQPREARWWQI